MDNSVNKHLPIPLVIITIKTEKSIHAKVFIFQNFGKKNLFGYTLE